MTLVDKDISRNDEALIKAVEWDSVNWSRAVKFWKQNSKQNWAGSKILEIGARNGGLTLWFAAQGATVVCSDLEGPSEKAQEKFSKSRYSSSIEVQCVDAMNIPYPDNTFDMVVFKSVLGGVGGHAGLDGQKRAMEEMHRVIKPGGELLFAENLCASFLHRLARRLFVKWGQRWRYISIQETKVFSSRYSCVNFKTLGFLAAFGRSDGQRKFLGKLDSLGLDAITPKNWCYIITGVAVK